MIPRLPASRFLVLASIGLFLAIPCYGASNSYVPLQTFSEFLNKIASEEPDPCSNGPEQIDNEWEEFSVFVSAENYVTEELNSPLNASAKPAERATAALKKLETASAQINAAWPQDNRFHFQLLDLQQAIVVKISIRTHDRYSVIIFGKHSENSKESWQAAGSGGDDLEGKVSRLSLDLFPLQRGPSLNPRFLAQYTNIGCAGNAIGVTYDAEEVNASGDGSANQIIKQEGAFGLSETAQARPTSKHPFAPIGTLHTQGRMITLPYCWFSAIDTWDNPSMCAVDTYDLSGDTVRFVSRAYNRPDLVPIAKAIEFAEKRDLPATLAYCTSEDVARRLVRDIPPFNFAGDLQVIRTGIDKERVEMESEQFNVEKRDGRWLVTSFHSK